MSDVLSLVRQRPLVAFYVLAFAISWGAILMVVGPGGFLTTTGDSPSFVLAGFASLLGPSVAGMLMIALMDGRDGFRDLAARLGRWRVAPRWYAVALLTAPIVTTVIALALSLASPAFTPGIVTADDKQSLVVLALVGALGVSIFEELGWTGFATPRLLRKHDFLRTGVMMGILWGLWHLPLFAGNATLSGSVPPILFLAVLFFGWIVPYRVLMVWLYSRTQSVLLVMLMHAPIVAGMYILRAESASPEESFTTLVATAATYWAIIGVVAVADARHLGHRRSVRNAAHAAP